MDSPTSDTSPNVASQLNFSPDESDVGVFIGDNMSSDSGSFLGFPDDSQSPAYYKKTLTPPGSVTVKQNITPQNNTNTKDGAEDALQPQLFGARSTSLLPSDAAQYSETLIGQDISADSDYFHHSVNNVGKFSYSVGIDRNVNTSKHGYEIEAKRVKSPISLSQTSEKEVYLKYKNFFATPSIPKVVNDGAPVNVDVTFSAGTDAGDCANKYKVDSATGNDCSQLTGSKLLGNAVPEFSVDFSDKIENINECCLSLDVLPCVPQVVTVTKINSQVAPPSTHILHTTEHTENIMDGNIKMLQNLTEQTDKDNTGTDGTQIYIDRPKLIQTGSTPSLTDRATPSQTDGSCSMDIINILCQKISENLKENIESIAAQNTVVFENIASLQENIANVEHKICTDISKVNAQNVLLDEKLIGKMDSLDSKLTNIQTDVEYCKNDINDLRSEVSKNAHQVNIISEMVIKHTQEIKDIKKGSEQIEINLAEKLLQSSIGLNSKYDKLKEKVHNSEILVGEMAAILQKSKEDLDELKNRYGRLEGAINENRSQGNHLNNKLTGLAQNMICGTTQNPKQIETLLQEISPQTSTISSSQRGSFMPPPPLVNTYSPLPPLSNPPIPSNTSSPLIAPNLVIPPAVINQPYPFSYKSQSEDYMLKDMMKNEKTPSFDGITTSAPEFIEEAETYFSLVNITNDHIKVKVMGSFLKGVAQQWWKIVGKDIWTWDQAKQEIIAQYFNDYNRQKFKQEWKDYDYSKVKNVEIYTLRAFHLLDIIKPNYTFKKKCQTVASRLPAPLMNYLLQKDFGSEKEFMNLLKEAMSLTNFREDSSSSQTTANHPPLYPNLNNNNQDNNSNSNYGNNNNNSSFNDSSSQIITNPNFKGRPANFIPNYRPPPRQGYNPNGNRGNQQGQNNGNYNNGSNNRSYNNGFSNSNYNNRGHNYSNNQGGNNRQSYRPYNNHPRGNGGNNHHRGNQPQQNGVNNLATIPVAATPLGPTITPPTPSATPNNPPSQMLSNQDVVMMPIPATFFQQILQAGLYASSLTSSDGQNPNGPVSSN